MVRTAGRRQEIYRPVNPSRIPEAISSRRTARGWSQSELAERLFVNRSLVSRWEKGTRVPGGPELLDLMALLEFTRDDIC